MSYRLPIMPIHQLYNEELDVTIVLPCLNEAETLADCIHEIREALSQSGLQGEIIVADNGSVDGSVTIALSQGAKVVHASPKGYGVALSAGISEASADIVIMGDADCSYDFGDIPRFAEAIRSGFSLVVGNRFQVGILPGAMPWTHLWIGNPVLTTIGRVFFRSHPISLCEALEFWRSTSVARLDSEC